MSSRLKIAWNSWNRRLRLKKIERTKVIHQNEPWSWMYSYLCKNRINLAPNSQGQIDMRRGVTPRHRSRSCHPISELTKAHLSLFQRSSYLNLNDPLSCSYQKPQTSNKSIKYLQRSRPFLSRHFPPPLFLHSIDGWCWLGLQVSSTCP